MSTKILALLTIVIKIKTMMKKRVIVTMSTLTMAMARTLLGKGLMLVCSIRLIVFTKKSSHIAARLLIRDLHLAIYFLFLCSTSFWRKKSGIFVNFLVLMKVLFVGMFSVLLFFSKSSKLGNLVFNYFDSCILWCNLSYMICCNSNALLHDLPNEKYWFVSESHLSTFK